MKTIYIEISNTILKYIYMYLETIEKSPSNQEGREKFKGIPEIDRSDGDERKGRGRNGEKRKSRRLFHNVPKSWISDRLVNYGVGKCKSEFRHLEPDQRLTSTHHPRKSTPVASKTPLTHRSDHRNDTLWCAIELPPLLFSLSISLPPFLVSNFDPSSIPPGKTRGGGGG